MRIVIKPGGLFFLMTVIALLSLFAFYGMPRAGRGVATVGAKPVSPTAESLPMDTLRFGGTATKPATPRSETLPGMSAPVTVYPVAHDAPVAKPWLVSLNAVIHPALEVDEPLRLLFRARSPKPGQFVANVEEAKTPFTKSVSQVVVTSDVWREHSLPFRMKRAFAARETQITFHCGFAPGTIEIADVRLIRDTTVAAAAK